MECQPKTTLKKCFFLKEYDATNWCCLGGSKHAIQIPMNQFTRIMNMWNHSEGLWFFLYEVKLYYQKTNIIFTYIYIYIVLSVCFQYTLTNTLCGFIWVLSIDMPYLWNIYTSTGFYDTLCRMYFQCQRTLYIAISDSKDLLRSSS